MRTLDQVGIRELRQNLSVYLRRVRSGESLEVTDRGISVALLVPLEDRSSPLELLALAGRATLPRQDLTDLAPPAGASSNTLSRALDEERAER
jgi:prevent-host-death family protein